MENQNNKKSSLGNVYLIGAGPGEEELITVKGKRLIEEADCIVYDHLVNPDLLRFAKLDCEKIYVGKENGHHTLEQEEINALLAQKARVYGTVVRLKGGDVYVFGRGGEEGIYLSQQGIAWQVVPGISSALAGPAYAGIPLTHRGVSGSFQVITAHNQQGQPAQIDYAALAKSEDTCVFLMGFSKLKQIVKELLLAGKSGDCPVAVISHATLPEQRTCVGTLETIVQETEKAALTPPALVVVGEVVKLRPLLNFFEEQPLYGKKYLVTKVGKDTSELTRGLREKGGFVTEVQTGEIRLFREAVTTEMLSLAAWIVLTSRHGVEAFFASLKAQKIDFRILADKKFAVVGKKTAKALEGYGFYADLVPPCAHGAALQRALSQVAGSEEGILYGVPKGEELLDKKEHSKVFTVCLYENQECLSEVPNMKYDAAFFTCASSVKRLFCHLSKTQLQNFRTGRTEAVSIGKSTTKALESLEVSKIRQASFASYQDMLSVILFS